MLRLKGSVMSHSDIALPTDASAATDRESWLALMDVIGEEAGHFQTVGARHWAFFSDDSPTLLVTFEDMASIRATRRDQMPLGHGIAKAKGWSHLCLISDGETWFRDPAVYAHVDRLVDDAFFEDFDRVLFYGAGPAAHAACAFSVAAPGATVVAIQPCATLDPAIAGWDRRHLSARRLDFTHRYGYAPDMTDGAAAVFVVHDPLVAEDAMHAALFHAAFVTPLRMRHFGGRIEESLGQMELLTPMIEAACEGTLTVPAFARMLRSRRSFGPYLRDLLARAGAAGRPALEVMICRSVTARLNAPKFRRRLAELVPPTLA